MKDQSDEDLMLAYSRDSMQAFDTLYRRYNKRLYSYIFSKTGNHSVAEELFQKAFVKLHRSRSRYQGDIAFNKWMFTICRSELIDYLRKQAAEQKVLHEVAAAYKQQASVSVAGFDDIANCGLSAEEQKLLQYRFVDDLEFQQIAEKIGLSAVSVRKRLSRVIIKLRKVYERNNHG